MNISVSVNMVGIIAFITTFALLLAIAVYYGRRKEIKSSLFYVISALLSFLIAYMVAILI